MSELVVFDTNIFVSYFLSPFKTSSITTVTTKIFEDKAVPVFSDAIMAEYEDVLYRVKFNFPRNEVRGFLDVIHDTGYFVNPAPTSVPFADISDKCFSNEVA